MGFKNLFLKSMVPVLLPAILLIGLLSWKFFFKTDLPAIDDVEAQTSGQQVLAHQDQPLEMVSQAAPVIDNKEDAEIQRQLDQDRQQQKHTKELKIKLEQADLELEEEKAVDQINKLKKENNGTFNEPSVDGLNSLPEIKVDYIGGDRIKKEAILSIGGTSYQAKENSSLTDNVRVVSISDSSVTLHFNAPQDLNKTFDYKPE